MNTLASPIPTTEPWWRNGHVWLIISGPLAVVIAGFATLYLAIRTPDPVIATDYYRRGVEINRTLSMRPADEAGETPLSLAPAHQARNHAATGVVPPARTASPAADPSPAQAGQPAGATQR